MQTIGFMKMGSSCGCHTGKILLVSCCESQFCGCRCSRRVCCKENCSYSIRTAATSQWNRWRSIPRAPCGSSLVLQAHSFIHWGPHIFNHDGRGKALFPWSSLSKNLKNHRLCFRSSSFHSQQQWRLKWRQHLVNSGPFLTHADTQSSPPSFASLSSSNIQNLLELLPAGLFLLFMR